MAIDFDPDGMWFLLDGDPRRLTARELERLRHACYASISYLDRYHSLAPGGLRGAKRLVVYCPAWTQSRDDGWAKEIARFATLVWGDGASVAAQGSTAKDAMPL